MNHWSDKAMGPSRQQGPETVPRFLVKGENEDPALSLQQAKQVPRSARSELENLHDQLSKLSSLVSELETRLGPALRNDTNSGLVPKGPELAPTDSSPFVVELRAQGYAVTGMQNRLSGLISRLELE